MHTMKFIKTKLDGVFLIKREINIDSRGHFSRIFSKEYLDELGCVLPIQQINHSYTKSKSTIRGLHYQSNPYADMKIVTCIRGKIFDVIVDLRKNSKTFLNFIEIELSEYNNHCVLIPEGFAHGFQTLINDCELIYLHTAKYSKIYESGVRYDDPILNIIWPLKPNNISDRDLNLKYINENYEGL